MEVKVPLVFKSFRKMVVKVPLGFQGFSNKKRVSSRRTNTNAFSLEDFFGKVSFTETKL